MKFLVVFALGLPFFVSAVSQPHCQVHQHYSDCAPACEESCPDFSESVQCINDCVAKCTCDSGYVFDVSSDVCMKRKNCKNPDDQNAVFTSCNADSQPTCENPNGNPLDQDCEPGYQCTQGYILCNATRMCVLEEDCRNDCLTTVPVSTTISQN